LNEPKASLLIEFVTEIIKELFVGFHFFLERFAVLIKLFVFGPIVSRGSNDLSIINVSPSPHF
jgi:hypothetical protein